MTVPVSARKLAGSEDALEFTWPILLSGLGSELPIRRAIEYSHASEEAELAEGGVVQTSEGVVGVLRMYRRREDRGWI